MGLAVVVDAWHLGGPSGQRGIGTYIRELLRALAARDDVEVRALASRSIDVPPRVLRVPITRRAPGRWAAREHELRLPRDAARAGGDVFHCPALPGLRRARVPVVQTFHDATPLVVDDPRLAGERHRMLELAPQLRGAAAVIAVSHDAATKAVELLDVDPARVHVAHHGVDARFAPRAERVEPDEPYVLYVGEFGPHKGFAEAFELAAQLADRELPHRLRMASRIAPWYRDEIMGILRQARRPERVELLDFVPDLLPLYQDASVVVTTSRQEGFCLPMVEAMACGTPVVAFSNSAITEVVGDGGVLVADGDVEAMATAVERLVSDPTAHDAAVNRGLARSRAFDWAASAAIHAEVYASVA